MPKTFRHGSGDVKGELILIGLRQAPLFGTRDSGFQSSERFCFMFPIDWLPFELCADCDHSPGHFHKQRNRLTKHYVSEEKL